MTALLRGSAMLSTLCASALILSGSGCAQQTTPAFSPANPVAQSGGQPLVVGPTAVAESTHRSKTTKTPATLGWWVIAASDYCPSTAGTIAIDILAETTDGALITGAFGTTMTLTDSDTSGATHLSSSKIASAAQGNLTLRYSGKTIPSFTISATAGGATATTEISPKASCVNASPDIIRIVDGAGGSLVTLSGHGQKAIAPLNIGTDHTGNPPHACTSTQVGVTKAGTSSFSLSSRLYNYGLGCVAYATADAGNIITNQAVLILK